MLMKRMLAEILKTQKEIKELFDPATAEKARKYDELRETIKSVRLSVKNIHPYVDEKGRNAVTITYEPVVETVIAYDDEVSASPRFKAINKLDLIPVSDMRKISAAIEKQQKAK